MAYSQLKNASHPIKENIIFFKLGVNFVGNVKCVEYFTPLIGESDIS